jgi:hypothetical protein
VSGAIGYSISLSNATAGSLVGINRWYTAAEVDPGNTGIGTIVQATPLAVGYQYVWSVNAQNAFGVGPWSTDLVFSVGTAIAPFAPVPVTPSGSGQSTTPTYTFRTVSGGASYSIFLYDITAGTSSVTSWYTAAAVDPGNTGTGTILQPTALVLDHQYAWYVNAQNAFGVSPWSSFLIFSVGTPPIAPTPISPNTTGQSTTPTYTFSTVSGAASYSIFLYDITAGTSSVTSWYTATAVDPGNTGTGTILQPTALVLGHQYAWYVNAQNRGGVSPWSSFLVFKVGP